jgi:hypothetical protein
VLQHLTVPHCFLTPAVRNNRHSNEYDGAKRNFAHPIVHVIQEVVPPGEVEDRLLGHGDAPVVDDDVAPNGQLPVQVEQDVHRAFVHVTVRSNDCELRHGDRREAVSEEALVEEDPLVEQVVRFEVLLDLQKAEERA